MTFALCLLSATVSEAGPKTDIVVLKNGDHLTCEVNALQRGLFNVSTDDFGTVSIKWDKVVSVTTMRVFEVEMASGARYYGALGTADSGRLSIGESAGALRLDLASIVRLTPIERGFWKRLDGAISAGGSYTESSGIGQVSTSAELGVRRPAFEWNLALDSTTTLEESGSNSGRYIGQVTYTRLLNDRWVLPGFARVESNTDLGYDVRSTVGIGLGRNLVQTNRTLFQVAGGVAGNYEVPVGEAEAVTNIEAVALVSYSFFTYDYPKTEVTFQTSVFPNLTDQGRIRVNVHSVVSRAILTNDLFVSITMFDDYDNRPLTPGAKVNDIGIVFSAGWKF